ncbi:MAG: hypothetical protein HGA37_17935 [Lentimicrobium sp.]|nr:hypothetical protein [Lentimicrobium sp.]
MLKKITYTIISLIAGFVGGALCPWIFCWFEGATIESQDAVSIANTYIVFTTIIFVAATVILTVMGFVFTHQFSNSKKMQVVELFDQIKEDFKANGNRSIDLINEIMKNPDVVRHVGIKIEERIKTENTDSCSTECDDENAKNLKSSLS